MTVDPRARPFDLRLSEKESACEVPGEHRDLVMSKAALERFAQALDAPAEVVPEMVAMFRLPRILEA